MSAEQASGRYILVVGPDSPDRAWLESVLMGAGLEVAACSESELLAMPDVVPPRLVIQDDSSGRHERMAAFANIRAHPPLAGAPIVVLARDRDIDSFSAAITRGAAAYLVKPVAAEELLAVAKKIAAWRPAAERSGTRRRARRPLLMRADVAVDGRPPLPGWIVDASGSGCRVELAEAPAEGAAVRLTLYGVEDSTEVTLSARVRWQRRAADGAYVAGLRFTDAAALLAGRLLGAAPGRH